MADFSSVMHSHIRANLFIWSLTPLMNIRRASHARKQQRWALEHSELFTLSGRECDVVTYVVFAAALVHLVACCCFVVLLAHSNADVNICTDRSIGLQKVLRHQRRTNKRVVHRSLHQQLQEKTIVCSGIAPPYHKSLSKAWKWYGVQIYVLSHQMSPSLLLNRAHRSKHTTGNILFK